MSVADSCVVLVDAAGRELGSYPLTHPAELRVGQEIWLEIPGRRTLVRVLRQHSGGGNQRLVHAIEVALRCPFCRSPLLAADGLAGLEHDAQGDFVVCRRCTRRVAMERIHTTPPGGPTRLRVAADQGGWRAWE